MRNAASDRLFGLLALVAVMGTFVSSFCLFNWLCHITLPAVILPHPILTFYVRMGILTASNVFALLLADIICDRLCKWFDKAAKATDGF